MSISRYPVTSIRRKGRVRLDYTESIDNNLRTVVSRRAELTVVLEVLRVVELQECWGEVKINKIRTSSQILNSIMCVGSALFRPMTLRGWGMSLFPSNLASLFWKNTEMGWGKILLPWHISRISRNISTVGLPKSTKPLSKYSITSSRELTSHLCRNLRRLIQS